MGNAIHQSLSCGCNVDYQGQVCAIHRVPNVPLAPQSNPGGGFPHVEGRCPACGSGGLFLGAGGYVTCPYLGCTDPGAPSKALGVVRT